MLTNEHVNLYMLVELAYDTYMIEHAMLFSVKRRNVFNNVLVQILNVTHPESGCVSTN